MALTRTNYEERFEMALRRIVSYQKPEQLRRSSEKQYGLTYEEALEMAYENVLGEARAALHGFRHKRVKKAQAADAVDPVAASTEQPSTRA